MQIKCVVTGKRFAYNNFPESQNIAGLHPILTLSKAQLLKISAQSTELNAEDNALLFLAFALFFKLFKCDFCKSSFFSIMITIPRIFNIW